MKFTFVPANDDYAVLHPIVLDGKVVDIHPNCVIGWVLNEAFEVVLAVCPDGQYAVNSAMLQPSGIVFDGDTSYSDIGDYLRACQRQLN